MRGEPTDLFVLVKSLSRSEWSVIHRSVGKATVHMTKEDGETRVFELLLYLNEQQDYTEIETRKALGYGDSRKDKIAFSAVKTRALNLVFEAIELAKANQTPVAIAHRVPILITQLINRGVFQRANFYIEKYLEVAENNELFSLAKKFLSLKRSILSLLVPPSELEKSLEELLIKRQKYTSLEEELEAILSFNERLKGLKKMSSVDRRSFAKTSWETLTLKKELEDYATIKFQYLLAFRRLAFQVRNLEGWLESIEKIKVVVGLAPFLIDDFENLQQYVDSVFAQVRYAASRHEFIESQNGLKELKPLIKSLPEGKRKVVEEKFFLSQLYLHKKKLDKNAIAQSCKEFASWYKVNREMKERFGYLILARLAVSTLFIIGETEKAGKWLASLRQDSPSVHSPKITSFAWVITLILRIETKDKQGLSYAMKGAKKYFSKYAQENRVGTFILTFAKSYLKKIEKEGTSIWEDLNEHLVLFQNDEQFIEFKYLFPLDLWAKSKIQKPSLFELVRRESPPLDYFQ